MPFGLAVAISAAIALVAWRARALSSDGALAAIAVGTAILWPTGWPGFVVLAVYFTTSTLVSRLAATVGARQSDQADTEVRNRWQVLANGGPAALGALAGFATPGLGVWLATIALAASGGDTWATAMGSLSPRPPRDILRVQAVTPGTSGGVTWFGTTGGVVGAALIGLAGTAASGLRPLFLVAATTGLAALLLDSIMGSAAQARFRCDACGVETERRQHRCGGRTTLARGWPWLDNDAVNAVASGLALIVGFGWWIWLKPAT